MEGEEGPEGRGAGRACFEMADATSGSAEAVCPGVDSRRMSPHENKVRFVLSSRLGKLIAQFHGGNFVVKSLAQADEMASILTHFKICMMLDMYEGLMSNTSGTATMEARLRFYDSLKNNHSLDKLATQNFEVDDFLSLVQALKTNTNLTILILKGNEYIGGTAQYEKIEQIAECLKVCRGLKFLDLSYCRFGAGIGRGAQFFANMLKYNQTLTVFKYSFNHTTPSLKPSDFASALVANNSLQELHLASNAISFLEDQTQPLAQALQANSALRMLDLRFNFLSEEEVLQLRMVSANRSSLVIRLAGQKGRVCDHDEECECIDCLQFGGCAY